MNFTNVLMTLVAVWTIGTTEPALVTTVNPAPVQTVQQEAIYEKAVAAEPAYTEEDVAALARIVYWEARGESKEGQLAVANVVINRARDDRWPDTIQKVIAQKNQFTPYKSSRYFKVKVSEELYEIARRALTGEQAVPDDYVYFSGGKQRRYAKDFIKIGNHYFGRAK